MLLVGFPRATNFLRIPPSESLVAEAKAQQLRRNELKSNLFLDGMKVQCLALFQRGQEH